METGILHTHVLLCVLYLILLTLKVVLIVANRKLALMAVNAKTRIPHIVLASLMTFSGIFLAIKAPNGFSTLFLIKYSMILAAIGLGVVGVKRMNKPMSVMALILLMYAMGMSWNKHIFHKNVESQVKEVLATNPEDKGKAIYTTACQRCHGENGESNYRKAKILKESKIDNDTKKAIIKNGMGTMPAFGFLSDDQVNAVVEYVGKMNAQK